MYLLKGRLQLLNQSINHQQGRNHGRAHLWLPIPNHQSISFKTSEFCLFCNQQSIQLRPLQFWTSNCYLQPLASQAFHHITSAALPWTNTTDNTHHQNHHHTITFNFKAPNSQTSPSLGTQLQTTMSPCSADNHRSTTMSRDLHRYQLERPSASQRCRASFTQPPAQLQTIIAAVVSSNRRCNLSDHHR
ncbi:hypothetical protein M0R45_030616 [Rubus argutus]|uniref:Uncharacterized protein n=1 Tax=Rubus argutus TaxID=59490 RepID=A0AAW1WE66_RUBAR